MRWLVVAAVAGPLVAVVAVVGVPVGFVVGLVVVVAHALVVFRLGCCCVVCFLEVAVAVEVVGVLVVHWA